MNSTMKLTTDLSALLEDIKGTACIKNVHDPLYLSNQKIINRLESISGHKFKKTTKREVIVNFIEGMVNNLNNNGYVPERKEETKMKKNITTLIAAEDCSNNGVIAAAIMSLLCDIETSVGIKNVHSERYVSKQDIIDRFELATGEILSDKKTRESLIKSVESSFEFYLGEIVKENDKENQEVSKKLAIGDLTRTLKAIENKKTNEHQDEEVKTVSEEPLYNPLYNKEETSEIGTKIMAKILVSALKIAKANRVKSFISDKMLDKVVDNCLFGVPFDADYKQRYYAMTKEQAVKASQVKKAVVARTMLAYKEGYIVKPYYMAWTYKNTILTYRTTAPGAVTIYELDVDNKIIINTKTKKSVALDKANCEYLNNMFLIGMSKSK